MNYQKLSGAIAVAHSRRARCQNKPVVAAVCQIVTILSSLWAQNPIQKLGKHKTGFFPLQEH
jgi:hypothetical protein